MEKKMTKKEMFGLLLELLETAEVAERDELKNFVAHEIEMIENKAEKAKTYKRKKPADVLKEQIYTKLDVLEFRTIHDIVSDFDNADITAAKVSARLTSLVKEGLAIKEEIKIENRKLMGYKLAEMVAIKK